MTAEVLVGRNLRQVLSDRVPPYLGVCPCYPLILISARERVIFDFLGSARHRELYPSARGFSHGAQLVVVRYDITPEP